MRGYGKPCRKTRNQSEKGSLFSIEDEGEIEVIRTKKNHYRTKSVILACGAAHRQLGIPGEEELSGMVCPTVQPVMELFSREERSQLSAAEMWLSRMRFFFPEPAEKCILFTEEENFGRIRCFRTGCSDALTWKWSGDNVPVSIEGTEKVESLKIRNVRTDEEKTIAVDGVFIAVGILPNTEKFKGLVALDESGYIVAGEDGVTVHRGFLQRVISVPKICGRLQTAVADGANAVASVQHYLLEK